MLGGGFLEFLEFHCIELLPLLLLIGRWCGVQVWGAHPGADRQLQQRHRIGATIPVQEALTHTSWPDATQASPLPPPPGCSPAPLLGCRQHQHLKTRLSTYNLNAAAQDGMAVGNAATPAQALGKGQSLAFTDALLQSWKL